ncbi:myosin-binding protein 3 isoform X1 [Senna tora]|uniref:Myosin-binding protein 3 isoform X1 n=1 Tax=Senna tora TaxID=362788 RepID=A0A834U0M7_9FABA|nr:myosin-binding protein 3 isoform X1 [Senna tora]
MAANKFTTFLHRNTNNRITVALVYAILEWVLILLLLLNSLFSYAITKFAMWVGLKPPCPYCSTLHHVLEPEPEPEQSKSFRTDFVCEAHAAQISKMGFCSNHGRMAESHRMCEDCFPSLPNHSEKEKASIKAGVALFSWLNHEKTGETERCSCCNKSFKLNLNSPYLLLESSWGDGDYKSKEDLVVESLDDDDEGDKECEHQILSDIESFILREVAEDRSEDAEKDDLLLHHHRFSEPIWEEDRSLEVITMHFKNGVAAFCDDDDDDDDIHRMIPVELIDSLECANFGSCISEKGLLEPKIETLENSMVLEVEEKQDNAQEPAFECTQEDEDEDESSSSEDDAEVQNAFDEFIAQNNLFQSQSLSYDDCNIEQDIEEEDNTQAKPIQSEEPSCTCQSIQEDHQSSTSDGDDDAKVPDAFDEFIAQNKLGPVQIIAEDDEDVEMNLVEENHEEEKIFHHESSKVTEEGEIEEDKLPETPSSMDGLHYLQRKLMLLEKPESLDGTDTEIGDPTSTIERLKRALSALYQELEEERSASAIAANQTMAMITRLQEEKAAMQMEALQYQRMMEEQSEYDQEALQLLNDLMLKREKEKQELEKELEEYKQKVLEYEAKEKLRVLRRMKTAKSVKTTEESESIDLILNCEAREEEEEEDKNNNVNTTTISINHMSALDSSLEEFEEEKMSILYQLKELEEKLITLGENEQFLEVEDTPEEEGRPMGCLAKRLLPYLDEADEALMEDSGANDDDDDDGSIKVSIEEEVDHVYERLQALETDTDFLRHCMGSIQKGDKGMDLLQEILQHFRDLKDVELRLKDLGDDDDDDDPLV